MEKSKSVVFLMLIVLFTGFAMISVLTFIYKKQPGLVSKKMKIGAMILTLTTVMVTNSFSQKTCYKVAIEPENKILFFNKYQKDGRLKINLSKDTHLNGELRNRIAHEYSFSLIDSNEVHVYSGVLIAKDGEFNDTREGFYINLYGSQAGEYKLSIYSGTIKTTPIESFMITITGEPVPQITCYW